MRLLFALAAKFDLNIDNLDVYTAFLSGDLKETIYVKPPEGFHLSKKDQNKVLQLNKAMYGLKQSSRVFNVKAHLLLINNDFKQSKFEPCIYYKKIKNTIVIIALYVDDFYIFTITKMKQINLK